VIADELPRRNPEGSVVPSWPRDLPAHREPLEARGSVPALSAVPFRSPTQDLRDGASQIGGILTAMRRELPADRGFDFLAAEAYSAGVDFDHSWGGSRSRDWALWGFATGSLVRGAPEAMIRIQRASNHYFQRPDATRFAVDSTATSLSGREWRLQFERRSARHWTGS